MCEKQALHFVQTFFVACCFIVVVSMVKMHHFGHACHGTRLKSAISLGSVPSRFTQGIGHVYRDLCPGGCGLSTFDLQVDFAPSTRNLSVCTVVEWQKGLLRKVSTMKGSLMIADWIVCLNDQQ